MCLCAPTCYISATGYSAESDHHNRFILFRQFQNRDRRMFMFVFAEFAVAKRFFAKHRSYAYLCAYAFAKKLVQFVSLTLSASFACATDRMRELWGERESIHVRSYTHADIREHMRSTPPHERAIRVCVVIMSRGWTHAGEYLIVVFTRSNSVGGCSSWRQ